ncbi:MAG: Na(+) H(+) antiporter subunit F [uncultured Rubrobacteraceae bacterium]|uniref:Na(+) H(+) antiporter subunit F n=1 Tax=uncultured Rubrobacteraceae bacterium TaxID=349277 RepID=A0A6J4PBZ0_9ACTN|nr:MAG: Na(+) H(+) antiporter subunit F [uncultured Rubrobacteraceae bacterium]
MHELVFYAATAWLTVLLSVTVMAVIGISSTAGRILALDMLTLILVVLLVLYGDAERTPYYLDAALILALLAFIGTLAAARYYAERKIF